MSAKAAIDAATAVAREVTGPIILRALMPYTVPGARHSSKVNAIDWEAVHDALPASSLEDLRHSHALWRIRVAWAVHVRGSGMSEAARSAMVPAILLSVPQAKRASARMQINRDWEGLEVDKRDVNTAMRTRTCVALFPNMTGPIPATLVNTYRAVLGTLPDMPPVAAMPGFFESLKTLNDLIEALSIDALGRE